MKTTEIREQAFGMPYLSPSTLPMDYRFHNREYLIIDYETDIEKLRSVVPEPLQVAGNVVKYEFMKMPDSSGFGEFQESGQLIEVEYEGRPALYSHSMYLDNLASIVAGREIWGFPKKYGFPSLYLDNDTLVGELKYNNVTIAIATMGYKYKKLSHKEVQKRLSNTPNFLLKIIPHANGKQAAICQLVKLHLRNVIVKSAWTGPAALQLFHHALAPIAQLPVRKVLSASHILTDLTLGFGEVAYDYLESNTPHPSCEMDLAKEL